MAREVFTIAGQAIGFAVGGPIGAAIGSYIGASIGYAIDPLDPQYGPRLDDKRVQSSAYGQQVPLCYGVTRISGNVIWAEDLEEVQSSEDVGGKGGPSQEVISYSYYGTFAVLLCRGPIRGIRRIWADTVLIYDNIPQFDNPPQPDQVEFTLYTGTETQDPDPLIEAALGVGNASAYRGYAYIVFDRLPLERFGNRIPSLSIEVNGIGEFANDYPVKLLGNASWTRNFEWPMYRADGNLVMADNIGGGQYLFATADSRTGEILNTRTYSPPNINPGSTMGSVVDMWYVPPNNEVWFTSYYKYGPSLFEFSTFLLRINAETLEDAGPPIDVDDSIPFGGATGMGYYDVYADAVNVVAQSAFNAKFTQFDLNGSAVNEPVSTTTGLGYGRAVIGGAEFFCIVIGQGQVDAIQNKGVDTTLFVDGEYITTKVGQGTALATITNGDIGYWGGGCWDSKRKRYVLISEQQEIYTINDEPSPTFVYFGQFSDPNASSTFPKKHMYHAELDVIVYSRTTFTYVIDPETFEIISVIPFGQVGFSVYDSFRPDIHNPNSILVIGFRSDPIERFASIPLYATTVGAAVGAMCEESGYTSADYDVGQLTDILRGFRVMRLGPLRQAIEQLGAVFHFDGCEQDDQLVFKKRGAASAATYALQDLVVDSPQDLPLKSARAQESSLPRRLTLTAPDPYTDHQPGAQQAERWTVPSGQDEQFAVDVVLSADEAKRVADATMFDRWASRISINFKLGTPAMRLTYGDPITVDGRRYRIVGRNTDLFTITFEAVGEDADAFTQSASGAQGSFPSQTVETVLSSGLIIVDSALLRTADEELAAYAAVHPSGSTGSWRGAVTYSSIDSGANWSSEAITPSPGSTVGTATNALGNFIGGAVFDEGNTLTIRMRNGVPSSSARATLLNSDTNAAAVRSGSTWEIIQFRTVVNNGDGTYTLSGLLRGRRGTEHAIAGHAVGDEFVLLDPATVRNIVIENSELGITQQFRSVTVRQQLASASTQSGVINAVRLKPWAPVDLRAERNTSDNDIVYTWKRRSRWQTRFTGPAGMNVPESEATETYVVEVYRPSTTLRRTTTVTSPTWTYTTAMQTADGQTPGSAAILKIYQVSAAVGRGYPLEATK